MPAATLVWLGLCAQKPPDLVTSPATNFAVPFNRPDVPPFEAIEADIRAALATGSLTKGPQLAAFEREAAAAIGTAHAVGVSSCTSGLMMVLAALDHLATGCSAAAGRRPECPTQAGRREVIVPSFIFLAAPGAIVWAGMRPVFVDVDPETFTLDPAAVEAAIRPATAAILACHTFGCPCDMEQLSAIAERAGVPLIIDAAHGLGTEAAGRQVGRGGLAQVFSLSPTKLVVAGEGGLVATDCPCLAAAVAEAREYGNDGAYGCERAGINGRLPEISAALGRASLARLAATAGARREAAAVYRDALGDLPGLALQRIPAGAESSWKDFCIGINASEAGLSRDALRGALAEAGIDTRAYYSPPCHQMAAFAEFAAAGPPLPVTERLADSLMALPMGGHVSAEVAGRVADEVRRIVERARESVSA
jgi:dTDP-4-amino-4,6-dideoxygalactose transaminase